jgi:hypothetical protein
MTSTHQEHVHLNRFATKDHPRLSPVVATARALARMCYYAISRDEDQAAVADDEGASGTRVPGCTLARAERATPSMENLGVPTLALTEQPEHAFSPDLAGSCVM